jgi:CheY-like chemotaxis protein
MMPCDPVLAAAVAPLILVAEDNLLIRTLLTRLVTQHGGTPLVLADGAAALAAVHTHGPMLRGAILDIVMPHASGVAVAAAIRQQGFRIPIVLMSGAIPPALLDSLDRLHAISLFPKPFDLADLRPLLQRMVVPLDAPPAPESAPR